MQQEARSEEQPALYAPTALFSGDFNVGKSALINALLRRECLHVSREESHALPTLISRAAGAEASYAAYNFDQKALAPKTHDEFLALRQDPEKRGDFGALGALLPALPFRDLVLVDTAGTSSDTLESLEIGHLPNQKNTLLIMVTDIEYWSAKHTMDAIAENHAIFGSSMIVLANKADYLNASEIRRISDRARRRMEDYGISPAPRFIPLSARLELSREAGPDEYRKRAKRVVREQCDAGFDAFRVALYEYESIHSNRYLTTSLERLLTTPFAQAMGQLS